MTALALSMGDPAGIGLDIAIDAWLSRAQRKTPPFFFIGDPVALTQRAAQLNVAFRHVETTPEEAGHLFDDALPVMPLSCPARPVAGRPDTANAPVILESIELGANLVSDGRALALVTNPIAKSVLYEAGFKHPGHTEYLAALASRRAGAPFTPVMLLAGPDLRVAPVTIHIPLADVPGALNTDAIVRTGRIVAADLIRRFGIAAPRLAISGLNPHAGEDGALGGEDAAIIAPAVARLAAEGIDVRGPLPADTMFHPEARATYDAAICMYHDQALIPAKTLAFHDGVNVTLGLPFIRTSPDHGTAFGIAGTGAARADSLIAALAMARAMADSEASSHSVAAR